MLCGLSAGSLCWFAEAVTAFHGPAEAIEGLGLLPWSNCVHFDAEPQRCRAYRELLAAGMAEGYAVEDGAALHFEGERLTRVVSSRPGREGVPDALDRRPREPAPAAGRLPGHGVASRAEPRRIVAMGGGGFSAPPGDPSLDRYVLEVARVPHPRICLLPTAGGDAEDQIRRFYAAFRHLALRADAPVAVPARRRAGRRCRGAARPGRALRGRRQHAQPAGGLAGARGRRDPARGLGARHRPVRDQRGVDVLVRGRRDDLVRRSAAGARAGAAAGEQLGPLPRRAGAPALLPRGDPQRGGAAGLGRGRRRRAAVRRPGAGRDGQRPARRRRVLGRGGTPARRSRPRLEPRALPGREGSSRRRRCRSSSGARQGCGAGKVFTCPSSSYRPTASRSPTRRSGPVQPAAVAGDGARHAADPLGSGAVRAARGARLLRDPVRQPRRRATRPRSTRRCRTSGGRCSACGWTLLICYRTWPATRSGCSTSWASRRPTWSALRWAG